MSRIIYLFTWSKSVKYSQTVIPFSLLTTVGRPAPFDYILFVTFSQSCFQVMWLSLVWGSVTEANGLKSYSNTIIINVFRNGRILVCDYFRPSKPVQTGRMFHEYWAESQLCLGKPKIREENQQTIAFAYMSYIARNIYLKKCILPAKTQVW